MDSTRMSSEEENAMELLDIKVLFLQEQYRRCIEACTVIRHETLQPLEQTFIKCYSAFAHDELARAMHNFSHSKVLALSDAEQFYREALRSVPTAAQCIRDADSSSSKKRSDRSDEENVIQRCSSSTMLEAAEKARQSPKLSTQVRNDSPQDDSRPWNSSDEATSDFDDLESHDSFDQIMTPNRVTTKLERDYSSMSLLQTQPPRLSHGLMRPIRTGEPPRQYHVPPPMSYSSNPTGRMALPRLQTSPLKSSAVRKQLLTPSEQASPEGSPIAPVSPLGSEWVASDASTISSLSPDTPVAEQRVEFLNTETWKEKSSKQLEAHLESMRTQLESHARLVQEAKQQTIRIQSERAAARLASSKGIDRRIQQSHSFWSFTPVDDKAIERQRRIEAGRSRGWMRVRFDPIRYRRLAERALAEL